MSAGILFVAYGDERYFEEARTSIAHIEEIWPEVPVQLLTGEKTHPHMLGKIQGIRNTPFDRTLFLDTDCWLVEPVPEIFEVLNKFDLATSLCDWRHVYPIDVPDCFTLVSNSQIAYLNNDKVQNFLTDWERRFRLDHERLRGKSHPDMTWFHSLPSYTEALYHSDLRIAILGQEYFWTGTGYVQQKVKIIHKRPAAAEEAEIINIAAGRPRTKLLYGEVQVWEA